MNVNPTNVNEKPMNTNKNPTNVGDILGRLRDDYPAQMAAVDAVLFRAGFMAMGRVLPGCEDQVRDILLSQIPHANKYFYENMSGSAAAAGHQRGDHPHRL